MLSREVCSKCTSRRFWLNWKLSSKAKGWLCPHPAAQLFTEAERDGYVVTVNHVPPAWCEYKLEHAIHQTKSGVWECGLDDIRDMYMNLKPGDAI
jgi:hypothetical protein